MAGLEYVQLVASLPTLGPLLAAKAAPINRVRLQARLQRMLRPEHVAEINAAVSVLAWPQQPLRETDAEFVSKARKVVPTLAIATVRSLVEEELELRTVVAALRRRAAGQDAPPADKLWGYGRYVERIRANWREPAFGLDRSLRWILSVKERLDKGDAAGVERILLEAAWRRTDRLVGAHDFDFEAVALYVVRWTLLDRWTRYDAQAAAARFGELVTDALDAAPASLKTDADLMEAAA
jgi:hypothetical protein